MNDNRDAFDLWWQWAEKPLDSMLTIDAAIHDAVMALPPDERRDRAKVNAAVVRLGLLRPAGSEDLYGVPKATEQSAQQKTPGTARGSPIESRAAISTSL